MRGAMQCGPRFGITHPDNAGVFLVNLRPVLDPIPNPNANNSAAVTLWKFKAEQRTMVVEALRTLKMAMIATISTADQDLMGDSLNGLLNVSPADIVSMARTRYGTPDAADFAAGMASLQQRMDNKEAFVDVVSRHVAVQKHFATNGQPLRPSCR